ncbi:hypothetical protein G6F35_014139 [Rhizopus arrhizus]|nr:hypothetical protein G6F35_014139 [Rhizopus arrhizus]
MPAASCCSCCCRGPQFDPAGGLHRVQRGRCPGHLACVPRDRPGYDGAGQCLAAGGRVADHDVGQPQAGPVQGKRDHAGFLRIEEVAGLGHSAGDRAVRHLANGRGGPAADDLPPDATDGVRGAGAPVRRAPGTGAGGGGRRLGTQEPGSPRQAASSRGWILPLGCQKTSPSRSVTVKTARRPFLQGPPTHRPVSGW